MIETIEVKKRDTKGSRAMIKIRQSGSIPAILYGHGEENVCLTVSLDTVNKLIKHGTKLVNLRGEITDTALLRSVQWSSMGDYIIHVDFANRNSGRDRPGPSPRRSPWSDVGSWTTTVCLARDLHPMPCGQNP